MRGFIAQWKEAVIRSRGPALETHRGKSILNLEDVI